jgi:hypothetical protein
MKKCLAFIIYCGLVCLSFGQGAPGDKIYLHSGKILEGKVTQLNDYTIGYVLAGEQVQRTLGRLAVKKVDYANGKSEEITNAVVINGKKDWQRVRVVRDKMEVEGLKKGNEIYGKTTYYSLSNLTKENIDSKSEKNLKKAAAAGYSAPFVLLVFESGNFKKGVVFTYN